MTQTVARLYQVQSASASLPTGFTTGDGQRPRLSRGHLFWWRRARARAHLTHSSCHDLRSDEITR